MTDGQQTTVTTHDGRELDVTDDPDDIDAYATGLTVSLQRKISTADYESATPFDSIRAEVRPALALNADGAIDALREEAERMNRVVAYRVGQEVNRYRNDINGGER